MTNHFEDEIIELAAGSIADPGGPDGSDSIHEAVLAEKERPNPNIGKKPRNRRPTGPLLSVELVLAWAETYYSQAGYWPNEDSGKVLEASGENWRAISGALRIGMRGLPKTGGLAALLEQYKGVRNRNRRDKLLTIDQILAWADAYFAENGKWPRNTMEAVPGEPLEVWRSINTALWRGTRGLPGGSTIIKLLSERRGAVSAVHGIPVTEEDILRWAQDWFKAHGNWPMPQSGQIPNTCSLTWSMVHRGLKHGLHQLPGGSSLPLLLKCRLGVKRKPERGPAKKREPKPDISLQLVLHWAKCHFERTGKWPRDPSGWIPESTHDSWHTVGLALSKGARGLPKSTLKTILNSAFDARLGCRTGLLTLNKILEYADAYFADFGKPPTLLSGPFSNVSGESWRGIEKALTNGTRGLIGKTTLCQLLTERRWKEYGLAPPHLTEEEILGWADTYRRQSGKWPRKYPGSVPGFTSLTWLSVDLWLKEGKHGLPGGSTLAGLLAARRGVYNSTYSPALSISYILGLADNHRELTGKWPNTTSGSIIGSAHEKWKTIDTALRIGSRGLPGGSSLALLLQAERGIKSRYATHPPDD